MDGWYGMVYVSLSGSMLGVVGENLVANPSDIPLTSNGFPNRKKVEREVRQSAVEYVFPRNLLELDIYPILAWM